MKDRDLAETWAISIIAVIMYALYIYVVGPLGIWLVLDPFGVTVDYMGRVSIAFGLSLLSTSISSSNNKK